MYNVLQPPDIIIFFGAPGRNRTYNYRVKSPVLCLVELRAHVSLEEPGEVQHVDRHEEVR